MLKPKKRISKREMKEDTLVTTYFEAQSWFEQNRKRVSTVFFSVLVAGIAIWFYYNNIENQNRAATADLGKVIRYYDSGQYDTAINGSPQENMRGLQQIVDEYSGTESGELATFYLANSYYALGDYIKALQYYREANVDDASVQASVTAGIAACYEARQEYAEAARFFERAAAEDEMEFHTAENLFHAGRNYFRSGKTAEAEIVLKKLKSNYPTSPYAREADRMLIRTLS